MNQNLLKRLWYKILRDTARYTAKKNAFIPSGRKIVSFTFDDYPLSAIENGARILEAHKVNGTFYCSLGMAGKDSDVGVIGSEKEMLEISERGHECACHTFGHLNCAKTTPEFLIEDCLRNQKIAKETKNLKFHSFSYPSGIVDPTSKRVISGLYRSARTIEPGINTGRIDLAYLNSVALYESLGLEAAKKWLEKLELSGGWLIFYSHDVSHKPSSSGISVRLFEEVLKATIQRGFQIMTVLQATETAVIKENKLS